MKNGLRPNLWDRTAPFQLAALYALTWVLLALAQIARGASPGRCYVWTGLAEWAGSGGSAPGVLAGAGATAGAAADAEAA